MLQRARPSWTGSSTARSSAAAAAGVGEDDILDMLLAATDEEGAPLSDREVRDQAITLLFAGHDTTTSTISFLFYELARHPHELALLVEEQERVLGGRPPTRERPGRRHAAPGDGRWTRRCGCTRPRGSARGGRVERVRARRARACPRGASVNYCSWASHRLPDVLPDPEAFVPERFAPEAQGRPAQGRLRAVRRRLAHLHRHALRRDGDPAIATLVLQRFRLELLPGRTMTVRQMPTLSPRGGLPVTVRERGAASGDGAYTSLTDQSIWRRPGEGHARGSSPAQLD